MPSPGERRRIVERVLRAAGLLALAAALVGAALGRSGRPGARLVRSEDLPTLLAIDWSLDTLLLVTDSALGPVYRDWLAAARASGRGVRWGGGPVPALAVMAEPVADPAGRVRVSVAAPGGSAVLLADSAGRLDSVRAAGGGASFAVGRVGGRVRVTVGGRGGGASAGVADSLARRAVVVLGAPSWETKFTVAALEERGWRVEVRTPLSPGNTLIQGTPGRLDTSRVAAVVALDRSASALAESIAAFVRRGGGLVLGPEAAADRAFAGLRVGVPGPRVSPPLFETSVGAPRTALGLWPIGRLGGDATVLERRDGSAAVAARRLGAGRVVQVGYDDTWRWRMAGPEGSVAAHRRWWTAVVGGAAYRPALALEGAGPTNDAPLARMVAALGPPDSLAGSASGPRQGRSAGPPWWLFVVALAALVGEWASRRLRGAA